jgi:hypothetical protein
VKVILYISAEHLGEGGEAELLSELLSELRRSAVIDSRGCSHNAREVPIGM